MLLQHFTLQGKVELGYGILFVVCGSAYLVAWTVMHLLVPKFKQIQLNDAAPSRDSSSPNVVLTSKCRGSTGSNTT